MAKSNIKRPPVFNSNKYRGQWVALHPSTERVVGSGPTLAAAKREAVKHGVRNPTLYPVPKSDAYFIGGA